jgi:hypothetical protein
MFKGIRIKVQQPTLGQQALMSTSGALLAGLLLAGGIWYAIDHSRVLNRHLPQAKTAVTQTSKTSHTPQTKSTDAESTDCGNRQRESW